MPSPEVLNALFQGAVVLLGALGLTAGARANRSAVRIRDHRALQRRYLVALSHIFTLETDLAEIEDSPDDGGLPPAPAPIGAT